MNKIFFLGLVVGLILSMNATAQANLLSNAGFETAGVGGDQDAADWTEEFSAGRESWANHSGSWGMAMRAWENPNGWAYQDVSATSNTEYTFKVWALGDSATYNGNFYMTLGWYNGGSLISEDSQNVALATTWTQYTLAATAPSGTDLVRVKFSAAGVDITGKFDDAELDGTPIPEPTSMLLLGSGLIGLFTAVRRKK